MSTDKEVTGSTSATFDKGLRCLGAIAASPRGLLLGEVAAQANVHRTVAGRLLRTLEAHSLIRRDEDRRFRCTGALVELAESVERDLREVVRPVLEAMAEKLGATAYLMVAEGEDHARALDVIEPRNSAMHVAFKAGQRHPLTRGSGGLAILAGRPPRRDDDPRVVEARKRGYAVTFAEVVSATTGIASPIVMEAGVCRMSIGVSLLGDEDASAVGEAVAEVASSLARTLSVARVRIP